MKQIVTDDGTAYLAVWGNGSTGVEAGILGVYGTRAEAEAAAAEWLARCDNPACGAWARAEDDELWGASRP